MRLFNVNAMGKYLGETGPAQASQAYVQRNDVMSTATDFVPADRVLSTDRVAVLVREILERRSISRDILPDDDLREAGLNSLDMVNLMLAVEAEFDLKIPDADMTLGNFRTIAAIEALVIAMQAR